MNNDDIREWGEGGSVFEKHLSLVRCEATTYKDMICVANNVSSLTSPSQSSDTYGKELISGEKSYLQMRKGRLESSNHIAIL